MQLTKDHYDFRYINSKSVFSNCKDKTFKPYETIDKLKILEKKYPISEL